MFCDGFGVFVHGVNAALVRERESKRSSIMRRRRKLCC
jgi:hypothetical protein